MILFRLISRFGKEILFIFLFILCLYSLFLYLTVGQRGYDDVLVKLSQQFLKGHTVLSIYNLPIRDIANYYNNFYVYFGPLSSLILMPFVFFFGEKVPQVSIGIFSMIISFVAVYFIAKKFKFSPIDSLWLSLFFVFSTVLFSSSVINITAYQVEALGVPFILLAIWVFLYNKNPFLIGLFIALAVLTRFTLMLTVMFFIVEIFIKDFRLNNWQ